MRRTWLGVSISLPFLLMAILFILFSTLTETRQAAFTCGYCGNLRTVQISRNWWKTSTVRIGDLIENQIDAKHTHRWWQFDSSTTSAFGTSSWSRRRWEAGGSVWNEPITDDKLSKPPVMLTEPWVEFE